MTDSLDGDLGCCRSSLGHLDWTLSLGGVHCADGASGRVTSGHGHLAQGAFDVHHWEEK